MDLRSLRNHWFTKPLFLVLQWFARRPCIRALRYTSYDRFRIKRVAWFRGARTKENATARIVMQYHVLEKGLTMPARRSNFGHKAILALAADCEAYLRDFGETPQVLHAVGTLRAYDALHDAAARAADPAFWEPFTAALGRLPAVPPAVEPHTTREAFYAANKADFETFARSRHTLRHYAGPLPLERIRAAAELAFETAPSACNRQHVRLRCISDHDLRDKILALQGGARGFGHLADKLLVVTADLDDTVMAEEHNDVYVEGGIFLMNLCYALHYHRIAHCVLNWFCNRDGDQALRALVPSIRETEVVVAFISCGEAPEEFDVAASPRRPFDEVYAEV